MSLHYSVIISSAFEPGTIGKAVNAIISQVDPKTTEVIVVAPDKPTLKAARQVGQSFPNFRTLQDRHQGKPAALNLAFAKTITTSLILTDGDVYIHNDALRQLLIPLENKQVGAVTGHPVSQNSKDSMLGFWSHFLTDAAHRLRLEAQHLHHFLDLSGYLIAIRRECLADIPHQTLADDAFLSHQVIKSGYQIAYAPLATVEVKYPSTLKDWLKQKRRSTLEYWSADYQSGQKSRSLSKEITQGLLFALRYPKNFQQTVWLLVLFAIRLYLWLDIMFLSLRNKFFHSTDLKKLWVRVDSTK